MQEYEKNRKQTLCAGKKDESVCSMPLILLTTIAHL